jgi:hypothetical protein
MWQVGPSRDWSLLVALIDKAHTFFNETKATPDSRVALATLDHALDGKVQGAERINPHAVAARRAAVIHPCAAREHLARAVDIEPTPGTGSGQPRSPARADTSTPSSASPATPSATRTPADALPQRSSGSKIARSAPGHAATRAWPDRLSSAETRTRPRTICTRPSRRVAQSRSRTTVGAFAVTERQVGRPDLARLAERAPQN